MSIVSTLRTRVATLLEAHEPLAGEKLLVDDKSIITELNKALGKLDFFMLVLHPRGEPSPGFEGNNGSSLQRLSGEARWRNWIAVTLVQNPLKDARVTAEDAVFEVIAALEGKWAGIGADTIRGQAGLNRFFIDNYEPVEDATHIVYQVLAYVDHYPNLSTNPVT